MKLKAIIFMQCFLTLPIYGAAPNAKPITPSKTDPSPTASLTANDETAWTPDHETVWNQTMAAIIHPEDKEKLKAL